MDFNDNTEKLGAHEVAAWLRRHPNFLQQFPDLAASLVVPREDGPAASLASYQLDVLRDKNRELNRRLHELYGNAQDNERLAVRTHQLTLALLRQTTAADTLRAMAATLAEDFQGDLVRIVGFRTVDGLEGTDWYQHLPSDSPRLAGFQDLLASGEPVCGRLQALLNLPGTGLVAVGSRDGNRFFPGMGTLFLRMMGESLSAAMQRFA